MKEFKVLTFALSESSPKFIRLSNESVKFVSKQHTDLRRAETSTCRQCKCGHSNFVHNFDDVGLGTFTASQVQVFKGRIDDATRFIPLWVKIAVAIALGLGTMVGWRRIVVTVGEKIGKTHLTYAQGASAELVAMCTIGAADMYGLPVSTTHVLSSGVAGSMVANGSGLQMRTIANLAMAWVLTLPVAMLLSGGLYWLLTRLL